MHTAIYEFNTGKELLDITKDIKTVEITVTKNSNDSTKFEALIATKKRNEALLKIDEPYYQAIPLIHKLVNWDIRKKHIDFTLTLENRLNALKQGEYICIQKENGIFKFAIVPDNFIPAFDLPDEAYKIFKYDVASCVVASATVKHFKGKVYSLEDNILTIAFKSVKDFVNFIESMDYTDVESIITDENLKVKSDFKKAFQENRIMEYINII